MPQPVAMWGDHEVLQRAGPPQTQAFSGRFHVPAHREEGSSSRSQFATLKPGRGQHRKYLGCVFFEHDAIMATRVDRPSSSLLYFRVCLTVATAILVAYESGYHFA
jgi:hypothetical protein